MWKVCRFSLLLHNAKKPHVSKHGHAIFEARLVSKEEQWRFCKGEFHVIVCCPELDELSEGLKARSKHCHPSYLCPGLLGP